MATKAEAKLVCVDITDFGKIRTAQLRLDKKGNLVTVGGQNGAGKSTALDGLIGAIAALPGHIKEPVRKGADEAFLEATVNWGGVDLHIIRNIKRLETGKFENTLTVRQNGQKLASPSGVLKSLIGNVGLDPVKFADAEPRDQRKTLLSLVGFDPQEYDDAKRAALDDKKLYTAQLEQIAGAVSQIQVPDDTPDEPLDSEQLMDALEKAKTAVALRAADEETLRKSQEELAQIDARAKQLRETINECSNSLAGMPSAEILEEKQAQAHQALLSASTVNTNVAQKKHREAQRAKYRETQKMVDDAVARARDAEEAKAKALTEAKLPVEGIGFTEDGVTLGGVPWGQASRAEQLKAACQIMLAQAGDLRVLVVHDGSALDLASLAELGRAADDLDAQIIVERVSNRVDGAYDTDTDFIIEDGVFLEAQ